MEKSTLVREALRISHSGLVVSLLITAPLHAAQQTQPTVPQSVFPGQGFSSFLVVLVFLLFLCGVAIALKRYGPGARIRRSMGLEIIGQMHLGPRTSLAMVRAGETVLLLGVTQAQVTLIKELAGSSFEKVLDEGLGKLPKANA